MGAKTYSRKTEFDRTKDEELFSVSTVKGELPRLNVMTVKVMRYDGGEPKVQIYREADKGMPLKLGRLTQKEVAVIIPLLQKASDFIVKGDFPLAEYQKPLWNDIKVG